MSCDLHGRLVFEYDSPGEDVGKKKRKKQKQRQRAKRQAKRAKRKGRSKKRSNAAGGGREQAQASPAPIPFDAAIDRILANRGLTRQTTTPQQLDGILLSFNIAPELSAELRAFASELSRDGDVVRLPVQTVEGADPMECFPTVDRVVVESGGEPVYGWAITEWPNVYFEAEFHAVWRNPEGMLVEVSHRGTDTHTVFVADPTRTYEGKLTANRFYNQNNHAAVEEWAALVEEETNLNNNHFNDGEFNIAGAIASGDASRLREIEAMKNNEVYPRLIVLHAKHNE